MTSIGSLAKVARSIGAAGGRIADSVRVARELRDAATAQQRRRLVERQSAVRQAA